MSTAGHGFWHIPFELNNWDKKEKENEKGKQGGKMWKVGLCGFIWPEYQDENLLVSTTVLLCPE